MVLSFLHLQPAWDYELVVETTGWTAIKETNGQSHANDSLNYGNESYFI